MIDSKENNGFELGVKGLRWLRDILTNFGDWNVRPFAQCKLNYHNNHYLLLTNYDYNVACNLCHSEKN